MLQAQIYIDYDDLYESRPLYEFIMHFLIQQQIHGATAFLGKVGYGENQKLKRPGELFSFDETPMLITFIDEDEKVKQVLTALRNVIKNGLIVYNKVEVWE